MNYHDNVVKILKELADKYPHYSKVVPYLDRREPIKIAFEALTVYYYPDLWAINKRTKRIDVYEVWNTESEDQAIADARARAQLTEVSKTFSLQPLRRLVLKLRNLTIFGLTVESWLHGLTGVKIRRVFRPLQEALWKGSGTNTLSGSRVSGLISANTRLKQF